MFISSPYLGSLADHVGMKKIFKFMPLIYGSAQLIFGFSPYLSFIYLARIISGFASGGTYAVAFGYVSQISSKEEKAKTITEDDAKDGLDQIQKLTDAKVKQIDELKAVKEKDVLEV